MFWISRSGNVWTRLWCLSGEPREEVIPWTFLPSGPESGLRCAQRMCSDRYVSVRVVVGPQDSAVPWVVCCVLGPILINILINHLYEEKNHMLMEFAVFTIPHDQRRKQSRQNLPLRPGLWHTPGIPDWRGRGRSSRSALENLRSVS